MKKLHKISVSDDRIGPDEPLDEANRQKGDTQGSVVEEGEVPESARLFAKWCNGASICQ
jgi:hypothetical protein